MRQGTPSTSVTRNSGSAVSSLDRPIKPDDPSQQRTVAFSAFAFLFSEICNRANQVPTKVKSVEETEERLANIGFQVGVRSIQLAALKDPLNFRMRPLSVDAMLRLIVERLWVRWFGKQADLQKDATSQRYFITDDDPQIIRHVHPTPDYIDSANNGTWYMTYASYVGGMIRGVLDTCQYPAQVQTYHQPEESTPRATWFVIEFEPRVWERLRRQKERGIS